MEHPEKERLLSRMRAGRRARRAEALPQRPGTTNLAFHGRSFAERQTYKPGNRALRRWRWLYTLRAPNGNGVTGNARGSGRKHERLSIEELLVLVPVHNPVVPFSSQGTGLQRQLQAETMTAQSTTS